MQRVTQPLDTNSALKAPPIPDPNQSILDVNNILICRALTTTIAEHQAPNTKGESFQDSKDPLSSQLLAPSIQAQYSPPMNRLIM
jgi:hypothetical protein